MLLLDFPVICKNFAVKHEKKETWRDKTRDLTDSAAFFRDWAGVTPFPR